MKSPILSFADAALGAILGFCGGLGVGLLLGALFL